MSSGLFSRTFPKKLSLSWNLLMAIGFYTIFGLYSDVQMMLFSTLSVPLNQMYNDTLYRHYRIVASQAGVSMISSSMTMGFAAGVAISTIFILPRLDSRGRKFVTVYVRFFAGTTAAIFQLIAGLTSSAELYFLGQIVIGISMPCFMMATSIFLTECAPSSSRGFVSTSLQIGNLLGALLMYFLSEPDVLGNAYYWPVIPAITLVLSIILFICTIFLPESPRWLVSKNKREEARRSVMFYQGKDESDADGVLAECLLEKQLTSQEKLSPKEVWQDDSLRTALFIAMAIQGFQAFSAMPVEGLYTVTIHTTLGLTIQQSMTLNFVVHLISAPLRLLGTLLMDRFGRRFVFFLAATIGYIKIFLMVIAQCLVTFGPTSNVTVYIVVVNEILSELYGATGIGALSQLLITELFPPSARVSAAQIIFVVMFVSALPMMVIFPVVYSIFSPGFYMILMLAQPVIIIFLYKNLPETASKSIYDIVHQLDDEVRSRSNTKRHSIVSERQRLLTNASIPSYSGFF